MFDILLTVISFIIVFSMLVLIHEFGHFITAKKSSVKVEEFGLGLPPRAKKIFKDKHGTIYSLNWIPFGGFVKMKGEDDFEGKTKNDKDSFVSASLWKRMIIVTAGVIMNFLLAIFLLTIVFTTGFKPLAIVEDSKIPINSYIIQRESFAQNNGTLSVDITQNGVTIESVKKGSLAEKNGFSPQDRIIKINEQEINSLQTISDILQNNRGKNLSITIIREENEQIVDIFLEEEASLGIYMRSNLKINDVQFSFPQSFLKASEEVARQSYITIILAKNVVSNLVNKMTVPEGVAGPVGIAQMTDTFVKLGIVPLLIFMSMLSISLGVLNILPFPALDGGRFLFMLFELITRKKPNPKVETAIHSIGYALLMILIIAVTWNDIARLFQ